MGQAFSNSMGDRPFEIFCTMIDRLPPKAVPKAAARAQSMLEEDLAFGRTALNGDTASLLTFCSFLAGALEDRLILPRTGTMECWASCVQTVGRLVAAKQLPRKLQEDIEAAFYDAYCCIMN